MTYLGPYLLGPNDTPENGIYTGDARKLAPAIPDESVDLIFTDPVYQNIDDYRWLAETAVRVLKSSGVLLVWSNGCWHFQHAKWLEQFSARLRYRWTFTVIISNQSAPMNGKIIAKTNRVIWFDFGGDRNMRTYLPDGYLSIGGIWGGVPAGNHHWGKSALFSSRCIECFTDWGMVSFDPFGGGCTIPAVCKQLNRQYLAFEIDPQTAESARQRVKETQPPLFVPEPEQMELLNLTSYKDT